MKFSVVVPTYNRPGRLRACVAAIAGLDAPDGGFELVVVDDGSAPDALAENRKTVAAAGFDARLIGQQNAGPAAARNCGAGEARGEFLAFTDDDCAPEKEWLTAFADAFARQPDALLGGRIVNALAANRPASASQVITDFAYGWAEKIGGGTGPGGAHLFATANLACGRDIFHSVGGFDESFPLAAGEDYDFCHHYQHGGGNGGRPAAFVPGAVVLHRHAMTVRQFWRQHFAYGRGLLQFRRRASARMGQSAEKKIGSFQVGLAGHCLRRLRGPSTFFEAALVGVSQVATLAGAAVESRTAAGDARRSSAAKDESCAS